MKRVLESNSALLFATFLLLCSVFAHSQVSPFMGIGNVQFLDNNGKPLTSGVLYSYQAGTTTQQATFTDYTGLVSNPNPIPFTSGARVSIWTTTANLYKFVLCAQNDGASCAPADVLFSVDQVPGGSGGSGGGPTFTGIFVSNSSNPASAGILRLSSGDSICFRNTANSTNLCFAKDTSDVLSWAAQNIKFPEGSCSASGVNFDYLCADSATHRWKMFLNGGSAKIIPGITSGTTNNIVVYDSSGLDIKDSGQAITFTNFEMTVTGLSNFQGAPGAAFQCSTTITGGSLQTCVHYTFTNAHTFTRLVVSVNQAPVGCAPNATVGIKDLTSSTVLLSAVPTSLGVTTTTGSATLPAGHVLGIGLLTTGAGCGTVASFNDITAVYQ